MIIKKKQGYGLAHKSNSCEYILCYNLVEIILLQENLSVTRTRLWRKTQTLLQTRHKSGKNGTKGKNLSPMLENCSPAFS